MITIIKIKTPKGCATSTNKHLKRFIVGKTPIKNIYISPNDDEFYWEIETNIKKYLKLHRNVLMFDNMVLGVFKNKMADKAVKKLLKPGQYEELQEMLTNQTTVEIVKKPSATDLVEFNETWWQKVKNMFNRHSED